MTTSSPGLQFENQVRGHLKRIGFEDVDGGPTFRIGGYQVDACGGWDDVLLVVECTQSSSPAASIHARISEVRGKRTAIRQGFKKLEKYQHYKRLEFAIATKNISYTEGDREISRQNPRVHLIESQTLEYYQGLTSLIGRGSLFNLLGELEVEPQDLSLPRVPAFRVVLAKNVPGYLFWCQPHQLLQTAYVARRESGREKYYQRMLNSKRLSKIGEFIQKGNIFPNNIIVAFDKKPVFRKKQTYENTWPPWVEFGELVFPKSYRSCWVIDGQHRLYSFGKLGQNPQGPKLAVFAFEPISERDQANFFIQINKEQQPVSPDLIWDLEGEMSPETPRGRISNCVKHLNSLQPLDEKIYLPLSGERKRGQLKMSGVCQDLDDTGLLKDRTRFMNQTQTNPLAYRTNQDVIPRRVATALAAYLKNIESSSSAEQWTGIFTKPGGITVALNVYEQILIRVGQIPSDGQLDIYVEAFTNVISDLAPTQDDIRRLIREQLTSYAQRRLFSEEILTRMQSALSDYEFAKVRTQVAEPLTNRLAKFERRLAELITDRLNISSIGDLKQKAAEQTWKRVSERFDAIKKENPQAVFHEAFTLGEVKEMLERADNAPILMPLFTNSSDGFGDDQAVMAALNGITRARNPIAHGRRMLNRKLTIAYLETLERLVGS